jgi:cyclophilin family peptidyl-prolyl cis-trans isomerase
MANITPFNYVFLLNHGIYCLKIFNLVVDYNKAPKNGNQVFYRGIIMKLGRITVTRALFVIIWLIVAGLVFLLLQKGGKPVWGEAKEKVAVIETSKGTINFEFFPGDAPETVENFIKLASQGFYDGLIFHRVVKNFVIQGGCPLGSGKGNPGYFIKAEFNDQPHLAGTVAMARSQHPHSAGSQFYICLRRLPQLDKKYTVFGQVTKGMDVVHAIGEVKTGPNDRPLEDVVMNRVFIKEKEAKQEKPKEK